MTTVSPGVFFSCICSSRSSTLGAPARPGALLTSPHLGCLGSLPGSRHPVATLFQTHNSSLHNGAGRRSSHRRSAALTSFVEAWKSTRAGAPTRFRAPAPPLHPRRRIVGHPRGETSSRASIQSVKDPAARLRADPEEELQPVRAAQESAPASAQFACRTCIPRRKTASRGRAFLFRR